MTVSLKRIISGSQLTNAATTYYTVGANTKCEVRKLTFCNATAGAVTVTVHLVTSGGSAADSNKITHQRSLAAGETWLCPEAVGQVLEAGGTIQALASAGASVTIVGSGLEVV